MSGAASGAVFAPDYPDAAPGEAEGLKDELSPGQPDTVRVRAGSQLFARFPCGMDALGVLGAVRKLAAEALGSESAVRVEVATGSVHIYITFLDEDLNISKFTLELRRKGARITFVEDPKGCFGYMTPVAAGGSWTWLMVAKPARPRYAGFVSVPTSSGTRVLILVHGDNLESPYLTLQYRLSPESVQMLGPVELLSPKLLSEWRVSYLVKPKDSLAVRIPSEIATARGTAENLVLEFRRGTVFVGYCTLSIADIRRAAVSQALSQSAIEQRTALLPDSQQAAPLSQGGIEAADPIGAFPVRHNRAYQAMRRAWNVLWPSKGDAGCLSRAYQLQRWAWDVFVCHAGEDKAFARLLRERMLPLTFRCFVDEDSLRVGERAPQAMQAAVRSTQIAVVLLCEEFFQKEAPQRELRWFLEGGRQSRIVVVPVFLGITVERCQELAGLAELEGVCEYTGVRHASERRRFTGVPVHEEETMLRVIQSVRAITGL